MATEEVLQAFGRLDVAHRSCVQSRLNLSDLEKAIPVFVLHAAKGGDYNSARAKPSHQPNNR
jgi:hypothetical protein